MGKIRNSQQKNWYSAVGVLITICFVAVGLLNINVAYAQYGGGGISLDYTAPTISNINVTVSTTKATITWNTDEASISWVVYGTTTAYGLEVKTTSYITSHSVTLTNLSPATTYHYSVKSKDSAGNIGTYIDKTFTTLTVEEVVPPEAPPVKPISKMTIKELNAEIARIAALIAQLQTQLTELLAAPIVYEGIPAGFTFAKNLSSGMKDPDVVYLKIILAKEGCVSGLANTDYFASKTLAGAQCLCNKYKETISEAAGYTVTCSGFVGTGIRTKLNELLK